MNDSMQSAYRRAVALNPERRDQLIRNGLANVRWLAGRSGFVYSTRTADEPSEVLVDLDRGEVTPLSAEALRELTFAIDPRRRTMTDPSLPKRLMTQRWNLWLADHATGDRVQLTFDGELERAWGAMRNPTADSEAFTPAVTLWSPDGTRAVTQRMDYRGVRTYPLVEAAPAGGGLPVTHTLYDPWPGDPHVPQAELAIVDANLGTVVAVDMPPLPCTHTSPLVRNGVWWNASGTAIYVLYSTRDWLTLSLYRIDPVTGAATVIATEQSERRIGPAQQFHQFPNVRVLETTDEVIWFSERDGWGHLYRYDARSGTCTAQVTRGEFVVQDILHLNEEDRSLLLLVSGLIAADPYRRSIIQVSIDTGKLDVVVDDDIDHEVIVAPERQAQAGFIDIATTVSEVRGITVRDWAGRILIELERPDFSELTALGWRPPERVSAPGADGKTSIYGTIFFPLDFDPDKQYPVLDHLYPGPQTLRSRPGFAPDEVEPFTALGIVGITIDGEGTPGRSRTFHDESWMNLGAGSGLEDHVSLIREVAKTRPWLDVNRVAVYGHSAGGLAALRAMELFPDFYTVGIASAGRYDGRMVMAMILEAYDHPTDPAVWARSSAIESAGSITGKLMLVHGEMDRGVPLFQALRVIDRLIEADRDFDLLIVPGDDHVYTKRNAYVERRQWDFLVRHLMVPSPRPVLTHVSQVDLADAWRAGR